MSKITDEIIESNVQPTWKIGAPDYNPNGSANPVGDAAYWRERAEKAEAKNTELEEVKAENAKLREAIEDVRSVSWYSPISPIYKAAWEKLDAALKGGK